MSDTELVAQLRRLVDEQSDGDAVVLVQRQLFNRVVGRLAMAERAAAATSPSPIEYALRWVVSAHQAGEPLGRAMDHAASLLEAPPKE